MSAITAQADAAAARISSGTWAAGASTAGAASAAGSAPSFPGPLAVFVRPLEELLDMFTGEPAAVYETSMSWEGITGDIADVYSAMTTLANTVKVQLRGATAEALETVLRTIAQGANSASNWTKVVAQALQLCVTIFETVRSMVTEALGLLAEFAGTVGDVLFGSWPWELGKKTDAIEEFAREVEQFVDACSAAARNALKAAQELMRLATDLYRAIVPVHSAIDDAIGRIVQLIPGGGVPDVPDSAVSGPNGAVYNVGTQPFPDSDLRFENEHDRGYAHSYDLGPTSMTTEELNLMMRAEFGHLFVPSRLGDNTQLNSTFEGVGQEIGTSLFGLDIPETTTGGIIVQQVEPDGFTIAAVEGHPEYPGEVAFRFTTVDGQARLEVSGAYDDTIVGRHDFGLDFESNPIFATISDKSIWSEMQGRFRDRLAYG